jgi:hypothetical protein
VADTEDVDVVDEVEEVEMVTKSKVVESTKGRSVSFVIRRGTFKRTAINTSQLESHIRERII